MPSAPETADLSLWSREELESLIAGLTRRKAIGSASAAALLSALPSVVAARQAASGTPVSGTKTIETTYGTMEIPLAPKRVVVMENREELDLALALDLPVRGIGVWNGVYGSDAQPYAPWLTVPGVEQVTLFNTGEPDPEAILAIQPDLIISGEYYLSGDSGFGAEVFTRIAPVIPLVGETWRDRLRTVAGYLERTALAEDRLAVLDEVERGIAARRSSVLASARIAIVRPDVDVFWPFLVEKGHQVAMTVQELGGQLLPLTPGDEGSISNEHLNLLADADAIVLMHVLGTSGPVLDNPLWQTLPAIAEGRTISLSLQANTGSVFGVMNFVQQVDLLLGTLAS